MEYSDGYVAFLDILGFSSYVSEEQNCETVAGLFLFVEKFCSLFNTSPKLNVNVSFFSDSIVISTNEFHNLIVPIYIAESYLKSELNLLFRGGITKGKFFHSNGITFGPAVVSAYQNEKLAMYSRIIVDEKIIEEDNTTYAFRDIDGKWCLNTYLLIACEDVAYGSDGAVYPEGDPGEKILSRFKEYRESIIEKINSHIGTAVVDKYIWRIKPFNYTCDLIANYSVEIPMFKALDYDPPESFRKALLELKINNLDYETNI